eukprot:TRINITY_DN12638_c0_g2_i3.p1 TRINITY_DN12638_c0_g2~~TRINITY_DN12638_c0_g2_i3.p1  ORF type:complete len:202 (+),score=24.40 TRINITY_DN12638_c0_g2_i3:91-696(+)
MMDAILKLDKRLSRELHISPSAQYYDLIRPFLKFLEYSGHGIPWFVAVTVFFLLGKRSPVPFVVALNLLILLVVDIIIAATIKAIVRRPRPTYNVKGDMFATVSVDHYSFPSGHTTRVVTIAALADALTMTPTWGIVTAVWAAAVSISRVVLGRHHILDVLAGTLIGFVTAHLLLTYFWLDSVMANAVLMVVRGSFGLTTI